MKVNKFFMSAACVASFILTTTTSQAATKLVVFEWEGYISPFEKDFEEYAKANGQDIDLEVLPKYVTGPDDIFEALRNKEADVVTPTNNYFNAEGGKLLKALAPIDPSKLKNYTGVMESLRIADYDKADGATHSVPLIGGSYGLAYNSSKVSAPDSWAVMLDPANKGVVSITKDQSEANLYIAQALLGIAPEKYYDVDNNPDFDSSQVEAKLSALISNVDTPWGGTGDYGNGASLADMKDLSYVTTYGFSIAGSADWKLASPKEGQTIWLDTISIGKHIASDAAKMDAAHLLIDFMISSETQQKLYDLYGVVMVNKDVAIKAGTENFYQDTKFLWQPLSKRTVNTFDGIWKASLKSAAKTW